MTPRVTVLLPVRNGLPWLREAVESVLAQTYRDFELLVVDNVSTDGSAAAVEAYGDPRVRVLRNDEDRGYVVSLNRGLEEARGEYVARLDADDRMLPERLALQVAALDAEPSVALVGAWMDVVSAGGDLWGRVRGRVRSYPEFVFAILADRYPWGHPSLMYRRDVVRGLGGYDPSLLPAEDKDLYRRLALARHDARAVERPLVLYRRHEHQLSLTRADVQKRHDRAGQERFLAELGVDDPGPLRLLLGGDPLAWDEQVDYTAALASLVAGAARRLRLDAAEAAELERLLARHVVALAAAAWRAGARTQWLRTPRVVAAAARRGGAGALPAYAASLGAAPLARPLTALPPLLRSRRLDPARRAARRWRLLRGLYGRLPGRE